MRKIEITPPDKVASFAMRHPEGLFCPICGSEAIVGWAEIYEDWETWSDEKKRSYEICPCCGYGSEDFPYEDF